MGFMNAYEDATRADAYSKLRFPGTYYLAIPALMPIMTLDLSDNQHFSTAVFNRDEESCPAATVGICLLPLILRIQFDSTNRPCHDAPDAPDAPDASDAPNASLTDVTIQVFL